MGEEYRTGCWAESFPPLDRPWALPLWFVDIHAGTMMAYPARRPSRRQRRDLDLRDRREPSPSTGDNRRRRSPCWSRPSDWV